MRMRFATSLSLIIIGLSLGGSSVGAQAPSSMCKDGTASAAAGRGACSGHGGVDAKATKKAMKAAKKAEMKMDKAASKADSKMDMAKSKTDMKMDKGQAKTEAKMDKAQAKTEAKMDKAEAKVSKSEDNDPAGAIAQCKDGMYSHAKQTRGACSRHGGIGKKMK